MAKPNITYHDECEINEIGGKKYQKNGSYNPKTNTVKICKNGTNPEKTKVHELMHSLWEKKFTKEDKEWFTNLTQERVKQLNKQNNTQHKSLYINHSNPSTVEDFARIGEDIFYFKNFFRYGDLKKDLIKKLIEVKNRK